MLFVKILISSQRGMFLSDVLPNISFHVKLQNPGRTKKVKRNNANNSGHYVLPKKTMMLIGIQVSEYIV